MWDSQPAYIFVSLSDKKNYETETITHRLKNKNPSSATNLTQFSIVFFFSLTKVLFFLTAIYKVSEVHQELLKFIHSFVIWHCLSAIQRQRRFASWPLDLCNPGKLMRLLQTCRPTGHIYMNCKVSHGSNVCFAKCNVDPPYNGMNCEVPSVYYRLACCDFASSDDIA